MHYFIFDMYKYSYNVEFIISVGLLFPLVFLLGLKFSLTLNLYSFALVFSYCKFFEESQKIGLRFGCFFTGYIYTTLTLEVDAIRKILNVYHYLFEFKYAKQKD